MTDIEKDETALPRCRAGLPDDSRGTRGAIEGAWPMGFLHPTDRSVDV